MSARKIDGAAIAAQIRSELKQRVDALAAAGRPPGLAVVLIGDNPASALYVRSKMRAGAELGIRSVEVLRPAGITTEEALAIVGELNADPSVDGILVQLPLPPQVDTQRVLIAVDPGKDVDGFHPINAGNLMAGRPGFVPCTPAGIIQILERSGVRIAGQNAVVVGRSDIVGKPLALLLLRHDATVTIAHSRTRDLAAVCRGADILVAAAGRPGLIGREHIKPGAVVVDVGSNKLTQRAEVERFYAGDADRLAEFERRGATWIGDVEPAAVRALASAYTPVPGGVGPLTIAMLMANTVAAAEQRRG